MKAVSLFMVGAALFSCGNGDAGAGAVRVAPLRKATLAGRLSSPALIEASGVVRSSREPNVFWSQNDSGNDEYLFAYDSTGRALGAVRVRDAKNRDWEAIALGPCASGSCLYIGDVGDNLARHDKVRIWRVPEPLSTDTVTPPAERLSFVYRDGSQDVESMWVDSDTSIYLLTKRPARDSARQLMPARLYVLAPVAWTGAKERAADATAEFVNTVPIVPVPGDSRTWITDAALSGADSAGHRFLAIRANSDVYVFGTDSLRARPTVLLGTCSLRALKSTNGEGVTWLADGRLLFNSEGQHSRLYAGRCP